MRKEKSYSFPAILAAAAILLAYLCRITTKFGFELRLREELILPLTLLRSILTAKGRSYSDPIYGVDGKIDIVIFFSDPLTAQPHDPDVKALLRIAQVYDIPIANNRATADFILTSAYMQGEYRHQLPDFRKYVIDRVSGFNK